MKSTLTLFAMIFLLTGCKDTEEKILKNKIEHYFKAWNQHAFESPEFALFKNDTSRTWHGEKEGEGSRSVFNPRSGWKQWDVAWNGSYKYDSVIFDKSERSVTGKFNETTDFLKQIGMPEGFSAVVTFWFDEDYRVTETLYAWDSNNQSMHDKIKPLVEWAQVNDSATINRIYLKDGFKPSTENATHWKRLLNKYAKSNEKLEN